MARYIKGRNIRIEVATAFDPPVTTAIAITLAEPGVVTDNAHGLLNNAVGYWDDMLGAELLEEQPFRVKGSTTNTFELQGMDTSTMTAFVSGTYHIASAWSTLSESTAYTVAEAVTDEMDGTTLLDTRDVIEAGNIGAQPMTIPVMVRETPDPAMAYLIASAELGRKCLIRVTLPNGALRLYYGAPSGPGEDVQLKAYGRSSITIKGRGRFLRLPA